MLLGFPFNNRKGLIRGSRCKCIKIHFRLLILNNMAYTLFSVYAGATVTVLKAVWEGMKWISNAYYN